MASRRHREAVAEFLRRRAAYLGGLVVGLARRLGRPARRGVDLAGRYCVVPAKYLRIIHGVAIALALGMLALALPAMLFGAFPHWFSDRRLPLQEVRGVVPGEDAVFIGSSSAGRVCKFDLNGEQVDWHQFPFRPITLSRRDAVLIVRGQPIEDPAFRPGDPARAVSAEVEHTWWGHPILVVRRPGATERRELQPWYFTLVQTPWPGLVWWAFFIACLMMAAASGDRRRRPRRAGDQPST
jgi:hypothetical protein